MLAMENSEEVMQILERFTKLKQKDIPKELEEYLCYVAKTGDTVYRWSNVKYLFREKLVHVIKDFHDTTPSVDDLPHYPNVDPFNYETMKSSLLERLEMFTAAPFTVQRLCELLTEPRKQYSRIDKFMRALEKNILVVSTIEPGRKQPESENGDSLDSVVNGDLSLDVNVDIDMEGESIFGVEPQNTGTCTTTATTSSFTKNDEESTSLPKKPKLDIVDDTPTKTKSDSESDEASDDSDSSDTKEQQSREDTSNKSEQLCKNVSSELDEKANEKTTACEIQAKTVEENNKEDENSKENNSSDLHKKSENLNLKSEENVKTSVNNTKSKSKADSTHSPTITVSKEERKDDQKTNQTEKKFDESGMEKNIKLDEKLESIKEPDSTDSDSKELEKLESKVTESETCNSVQVHEIRVDVYHSSDYCSPSVDENRTLESELGSNAEINLKDDSNASPSTIDSSSSSNDTSSSVSSSDVVQKISDDMSVEDSATLQTSTVLLPQTNENLILSGNEVSTTTTEDIATEPLQTSDQPMDEANVALSTMTGNGDAGGVAAIDEIMQSDDKVDLAGMEVDDQNQEEAMDQ